MSTVSISPKLYFSDYNTRFVFLDGNFCKKMENCYTSLAQQLSLPEYFGHNLDALDEVLSDLDWIAEPKIKIIILNKNEILSEDTAKKDAFISILNNAENEKLEIVYVGEQDTNKIKPV